MRAAASPADPSAPADLRTIEPLAQYVPQTSCDPHTRPGSQKLGDLLTAAYPGTTFASAYDCATDGTISEHYEGRAVDWMVSVHDKIQHTGARAVIKWLFATDRYGNDFARARRLGVMYIVWNDRIWGSWDGSWHPYRDCADTPQSAYDNGCHRTHMHISLSWEGALGATSFWTGSPAGTDYGPCVRDGLNWAANHKRVHHHPCAAHTGLTAAPGDNARYRGLVTYAGARVRRGYDGPIVSAVQAALRITVTGHFGKRTRTAVEAFQTAHGLAPRGRTNLRTWRALLAAVK